MDKSDIQESVVSLYLRLNGYFVSGFIVHATKGTTTEMDVLAVRFPSHQEPEREVQCCEHLAIPAHQIDFIVGEVKGGQGDINFNSRFRENNGAIRTVLHRLGAFNEEEMSRMMAEVPALLDPAKVRKASSFPELEVAVPKQLSLRAVKVRFVPFAAEQHRPQSHARPYVFGSDLLEFVWHCFRPEQQRPLCDDHYNYDLWGQLFSPMVRYFKDPTRQTAGTIEDLYRDLLSMPPAV